MANRKPICGIPYLTTVANFILGLFLIDKVALVIFDPDLDDPYQTGLELKISNVAALEDPVIIENEIEENIVDRNLNMDNVSPYLNESEFAVKKCLADGSITGTLKSFEFPAIRKSIRNYSIEKFHDDYGITFAKLLINSTALNAKGFTPTKRGFIKTFHDAAWLDHNNNLALETTKNTLVDSNNLVIMDLSDELSALVNTGQSWASSSPVNPAKKLVWIMRRIVKANVPAIEKVPFLKYFKPTETRIVHTNMPGNHTMQYTLKSDEPMELGKSETKSGIPTQTMLLKKDQLVSILKKDIPGTGEFIKIMNPNLKKGKVLCHVIKPS